MTDEELDVEEETDEEETLTERAERELQQANQVDAQLNQVKDWSVETAAEIRTRAQVKFEEGRIDEEELQQLETMAAQIRTIYQRID